MKYSHGAKAQESECGKKPLTNLTPPHQNKVAVCWVSLLIPIHEAQEVEMKFANISETRTCAIVCQREELQSELNNLPFAGICD